MTFQAEDLATWKPGVSGRFETFGGRRLDRPAPDVLVSEIRVCIDAGRTPCLRTPGNNLFNRLKGTGADPRNTGYLKPKDRYIPFWVDLGEDYGEWFRDLMERVDRAGVVWNVFENNEAQLANDRDDAWQKPISALWSAFRFSLGPHADFVKVCAYDDFGDLDQRLAAQIYDFLLVAAYPAFIGLWHDGMPENCVPELGGWKTDHPKGNENEPSDAHLEASLILISRRQPPFAVWFDRSVEPDRSHMLRSRLPSSGNAPVVPDRPPPPRPDTAREIALQRVADAQRRIAEGQGLLDQALEALE